MQGAWVENDVDSIESTWIVSPAVDSLYQKSICTTFKKYSIPGLCRVGWKCCWFDLIRSNQHESCPLLSICHSWSQLARDLEKILHPGSMQGGLKKLLIQLNSIASTQIVSPAIDSLHQKSICVRLRKYGMPIPIDSNKSTQIVSFAIDSS